MTASLETPGSTRAAARRLQFLVIGVMFAIAAGMPALAGRFLSDTQVFWGIAIIFLGALPSIIYLGKKNVFDELPLMPLHGMFYLVSFGLPIFDYNGTWWGVRQSTVEYAQLLAATSILVMYFFYYIVGGIAFRKLKPYNFRVDYRSRNLNYIMGGLLVLHFFANYLSSLPSVGHIISATGWVALGYFYIQVLNGRVNRVLSYGFYLVVVPLEVFTYLSAGVIAPLMLFILFMMLINWSHHRRFPYLVMVLLVASYLIINPVKGEYRAAMKVSGGQYTLVEKSELFLSLIVNRYVGDGGRGATLEENVDSNVGRVNHISLLGYVVETTPDQIPYWEGETYKFLLTSFVPRAVWPDKPTAPQGNEFGHRYGLVPLDHGTTFNLPWLPEFYVNYGIYGVYIGMGMVGLAFSLFVKLFSWPIDYPIHYLIGVIITINIFFAESNLALMLGGVINTIVLFSVLLFLMSMRIRAS